MSIERARNAWEREKKSPQSLFLLQKTLIATFVAFKYKTSFAFVFIYTFAIDFRNR